MKVSELIVELQKLNQELEVVILDYEYGHVDISDVKETTRDINHKTPIIELS